MKDHFKMLGMKARDVVSGFEGIVESISFDLYGCIQAALRPPRDMKKPAEWPDGRWFDIKRLEVIGKKPVMTVPNFALPEIGAAEKPAAPSSRAP